MVQTLYASLGQVPSADDVAVIIRGVCTDLQTRFKTLTLHEVKIALDNGVRGEYGEYFGINIVSINRWLKAYSASDERKEALRIYNTAQLPQKCQPTNDEKRTMMHGACKRAYQIFVETGIVYDFGNAVYDHLDSEGLIKISKEKKMEIFETARRELIAEAKQIAVTKNGDAKIPYINALKSIENNNKDTRCKIAARAKRIALLLFFIDKMNKGEDF